jgi:hypothetical protein
LGEQRLHAPRQPAVGSTWSPKETASARGRPLGSNALSATAEKVLTLVGRGVALAPNARHLRISRAACERDPTHEDFKYRGTLPDELGERRRVSPFFITLWRRRLVGSGHRPDERQAARSATRR